jgi:hypothetical protein
VTSRAKHVALRYLSHDRLQPVFPRVLIAEIEQLDGAGAMIKFHDDSRPLPAAVSTRDILGIQDHAAHLGFIP